MIKELRHPEILQMYGAESNITELPDIFGGLGELRNFDLAGNFVRRIPPSFYTLQKLEYFAFSGCGIAELSEALSQLTGVDEIVLDDNMLTSLPASLAALSRLKKIDHHKTNCRKRL